MFIVPIISIEIAPIADTVALRAEGTGNRKTSQAAGLAVGGPVLLSRGKVELYH
jgi:hypothetical protein